MGTGWAGAAISTDDSQQTTIQNVGKRRLAQANQFGYLGFVSPSPLLYLSMGELVQLMFSDAYWRHFSPYFPGKKEVMKVKLDEIIAIRNSFAHFRPLREDDVEVVRQNAKHALMGVEAYLSALTRCNDVVPTNSQASWYRSLKSLGGEFTALHLTQSANEDWIELRLTFKAPVHGHFLAADWLDCKVVRLDSPGVLKFSEALRANVIYLTEQLVRSVRDERFSCQKHLMFVFKRSVLEAAEEEIVTAVRDVILKIEEEVELLSQDNLARGQLLSMINVVGFTTKEKDELRWRFLDDGLWSRPGEQGPVEYWGDLGWLGSDFITKRDRYPWMQSAVSGR